MPDDPLDEAFPYGQPEGARRKRGTGTLIRKGLTVEGQITLGGDKLTFTKPTWEEADKALIDMARLHYQKKDPRQCLITLQTHMEEWIKSQVEPDGAKNTIIAYNTYAKKHIFPALGKKLLADLTRDDIQEFVTALAKKPNGKGGTLSGRTIAGAFSCLHNALNYAVIQKRIQTNPAYLIKRKRLSQKKIEPFTEEEVNRLLHEAQSDPCYLAFEIALKLGLRKSEICALQWSDANLPAKRLRIRGTKTESSDDVLVIPSSLIPLFEQHRNRQEALKAKMGSRWTGSGFLFTNRHGGPLQPQTLDSYYIRILRRADIPHRNFHVTRHTCGSIRLMRGEDIRNVSKLLRHRDINITLKVYAHVLKGEQEKWADLMDDLGPNPTENAA